MNAIPTLMPLMHVGNEPKKVRKTLFVFIL